MWNSKVISEKLRCAGCGVPLWTSTAPGGFRYPLPLVCTCGADCSKQLMDVLVANADENHKAPRHKAVPVRKCEELIADEQEAAVLVLMRRGKNTREVAEDLQISPRLVANIAARVLEKLRSETTKDAAKWVALSVVRLDAMLNGIYDLAVPREGDPPVDLEMRLKVIDRVLRLEERRAKLLGLDAPAKVAQTDPSGESEYGSRTREDIAARLSSLLDGGRARRSALPDGSAGGEG